MGFLSRSNRAFRMPSMLASENLSLMFFFFHLLLTSIHIVSYVHPHPRFFGGNGLCRITVPKPLNSPFWNVNKMGKKRAVSTQKNFSNKIIYTAQAKKEKEVYNKWRPAAQHRAELHSQPVCVCIHFSCVCVHTFLLRVVTCNIIPWPAIKRKTFFFSPFFFRHRPVRGLNKLSTDRFFFLFAGEIIA